MKFLKTRIGVMVVTLLICSLVFGGISYAASYSKDTPATGIILKANPGLTLYSDAACTLEVTSVTFPDVEAGGSVSLPMMYLKNTGNKDMTGVGWTADLNPTYGSITPGTVNQGNLNRGEAKPVTLTLTTLLDGVSVDTPYTCTVTFTGIYN